MSFVVHSLSVDFKTDVANVTLIKTVEGKNTLVSAIVPISTPGNQGEKDIRKLARQATKQALREALESLERD